MIFQKLSHAILGAAFEVQNQLGVGLLENCYHNALWFELKARGMRVDYEHPYNAVYKGQVVGEYFADLVVEGCIILEVKAVRQLGNIHYAQLFNYLRISGLQVGYLLNFFPQKLDHRRVVI